MVEAAVAIQNLSMLSGNEAPIVQAGAIRGLVPLLSSEDPAVQDAASGALANLSSFSDHDQRIVQAGALPALAVLVLSPHVVSLLSLCTSHARVDLHARCPEFTCALTASFRLVAQTRSVLKCVRCAQVISEHSTALLRNLTAYNAEIKMRAFEAGCLKPAVQLLRSRERVVLQNSVATIRNLSFHPEVKVRLVEDGAIASLVGLLNSQDPEVQEHAAAALRNIMAES